MTEAAEILRVPGQAGPPLPDQAELLLEEFLDSRRLDEGTQRTYTRALQSWCQSVETPLRKADAQVVTAWYSMLKGRDYSPGTIILYAVKLRVLYAWTLRCRGVKSRTATTQAAELFDEVPMADLQRQADRANELRDKVVTHEEYGALMAAADHPRVRALLATLYESAARPSEVLGLRVRDLDFRERYAQVRVSGKTGERTVPLVRAIPYLRAWLQVHPARNDTESPLFARTRRGQIGAVTLNALQIRFKRLGERAGLKRRIYPYMFRHTRLTELADNDLGEFKMKELAGWTPNSGMAARYIHLSGRGSLAPILAMEGVEVPAEARPRESPVSIRTCPRCDSRNEGDALYCLRCGLTLDAATAVRDAGREAVERDLIGELLEDPRTREALREALKGLVAGGAFGETRNPRKVRNPDLMTGSIENS